MIEVDKNTFQTEVLEAEGYVFVDFSVTDVFLVQHLCQRYMSSLTHTEINLSYISEYNKGSSSGNRQKILGLPVMAIYKDGEKVDELVKDDCTPETIEAMIKKYI